MSAFEFPEDVLNAPVRFWMCLNREHRNVTWADGVASCPDCGLTSTMTERFAAVLRTVLADEIAAEQEKVRDNEGATLRDENVINGIVNGLGIALKIVRGER